MGRSSRCALPEIAMDVRQLAELRLHIGYRIVSEQELAARRGNLPHAERRRGAANFILGGSQAEAEGRRGRVSNGWLALARGARRQNARASREGSMLTSAFQ